MLPAVIIGIGGTGKWVVTDVKKGILKENNGKVPDQVALLCFDLSETESVQVERFVFEEGKRLSFTLDYSRGEEFYNFKSFWAQPIYEIRSGKGNQEFPFIYRWLKEDDAQVYHFSPQDLSNTDGAGQRRQSSRVAFFLNAEEIYRRIERAISRVAGARPGNERIQIYVITSLAGGTGCGTFLDFIFMVHKAVAKLDPEKIDFKITTFFLLPAGFERVLPDFQQRTATQVNCFAALREFLRCMFVPEKFRIDYNDQDLKGVGTCKRGVRPVDLCYFIDGWMVGGTAGTEVPHYYGTCPAIADYILLELREQTTVQADRTNIIGRIGDLYTRNREQPREAPVFSTFGLYRYIFDVEGLIQSFAHRLATDIFQHFLATASCEVRGEVQKFIGSPTESTRLNAGVVKTVLEQPGVPLWSHFEDLFNDLHLDDGRDIRPPLSPSFNDIPVSSFFKRYPNDYVRQPAEGRVTRYMGNPADPAGGNTLYSILKGYHERHTERFALRLKDKLLEILERGNRKGNLDSAEKFLGILDEEKGSFIGGLIFEYEKFLNSFRGHKSNVADKVKELQSHSNSLLEQNRQKDFLAAKEEELKARRRLAVIECIEQIVQSYLEIAKSFWESIRNWKYTFEMAIEAIRSAEASLLEVRMGKKAIAVHGYVTEPDDQYENLLYELMFHTPQKPDNPVTGPLWEKLPKPNFDEIIGIFEWGTKSAKPRELDCFLPAQFAPLENIRSNPREWNYNFVNNMLTIGQLGNLKGALSIMDILALKGVNPDEFAEELIRRSGPLADFSPLAQQSGTEEQQGARVAADYVRVFAEWNITPPGQSFAQKLQDNVRGKGWDPQTLGDRHQIIRLEEKHFIKLRGFPRLMSTETPYRQHFKRPHPIPIHVFLADKNAAKYEQKLEDVLREAVRLFHPRVVGLLDDVTLFKKLTVAYLKGILKKTYDPQTQKDIFIWEGESGGTRQKVNLGADLISAFESLVYPENPQQEDAQKDIVKKVEELERGVVEGGTSATYARELEESINELQIGSETTAVNDLLRVIKIVGQEHVLLLKERVGG